MDAPVLRRLDCAGDLDKASARSQFQRVVGKRCSKSIAFAVPNGQNLDAGLSKYLKGGSKTPYFLECGILAMVFYQRLSNCRFRPDLDSLDDIEEIDRVP